MAKHTGDEFDKILEKCRDKSSQKQQDEVWEKINDFIFFIIVQLGDELKVFQILLSCNSKLLCFYL